MAACGQHQRSRPGSQIRAGQKFIIRPPGAPGGGSALACQCRAPSTSGGPRWRSRPCSKKDRTFRAASPATGAPCGRGGSLEPRRSALRSQAGLAPRLGTPWRASAAEIAERYEWLWRYAATHPQTGRTFWLVWPRLDAACVPAFLAEFAPAHARAGKRILLVWDGAPAHRALALQVPERISLVSVPAYTPELNPSERVWPLVKEGVANRAPESLDELEQKVCSRCQKIKAVEVSARTKYHWWPEL